MTDYIDKKALIEAIQNHCHSRYDSIITRIEEGEFDAKPKHKMIKACFGPFCSMVCPEDCKRAIYEEPEPRNPCDVCTRPGTIRCTLTKCNEKEDYDRITALEKRVEWLERRLILAIPRQFLCCTCTKNSLRECDFLCHPELCQGKGYSPRI